MPLKLTNNAFGTLAAGINSSATSITLTSGQGARFPTLGAGDYFYATLVDTSNNLEIVQCTARSTDVLTVVRAREGTTARAYSTGDRIEIRLTAQTFLDATSVYDMLTASTGYFDLPSGTTAQRPASPAVGMIRFNTTLNVVEGYHATDGWVALSNNFSAVGGTEGSYASGGTNYKFHTFTSSGSFSVLGGSKTVDLFLVAGGGGGGNGNPASDGNGGGGAGGVLYQAATHTLSAGTYSITVGAGGAGGAAIPGGIGTNGNNSVFGALATAIGGGGGGTDTPAVGSGGSGGGASCSGTYGGTRAGGTGTAGQGNNGGGALNGAGPGGGGGGGGGAGAVGATGAGSGSAGGAGGAGAAYALDNTTYYYGGGGGGSSWINAGGVGGIGGGGGGGGTTGSVSGGGSARNSGSNSSGKAGGAGGANTGGGGGSGTNGSAAGQGGSGIIIVRYTV